MTALVLTRSGLADSLAELFAPVDDAPIAALLHEHADRWETIDRLAPRSSWCSEFSRSDLRSSYR